MAADVAPSPAGAGSGRERAAALAGIRVLDLSTGIAGPFGARLLGDHGADVLKLEPPGGDPARGLAPLVPGAPAAEASLLFQYLNWNKRGLVLDLANPATHAQLRLLVERSDVLVESFVPGQLAAWGIGAATLRSWNPRLVVTSVTDFGQDGPYAVWRGSDVVHQAMAGIMQISGRSDRAPLKHGLEQALFCAGLNVAYATLAALLAAEADGIGEHVDVSIQACAASELVMPETYYSFMGAVQARRLPVQDPYAGTPIPTRDGFVTVQSGGPSPLEWYADVFGDERLREPRLVHGQQRALHVGLLKEVLQSAARDRSAKELFLAGSQRRMLMGMVQGAPELLGCEQLAARGFFQPLAHPATGTHRFPVETVRMSATPTRVRHRAPLLAEHQAQALEDVERDAPRTAPPAGATARLPLAGLRVLDLSTVVAVPYLAALLGDLGAEVIKVESPHRLDQTRRGVFTTYTDGDVSPGAINRSGIFLVLNRNKQSIVLDLARPEGREVLRDLIAQCDIVVENFTPRVLRGWGLGYEEMAKLRPGLILLSNTGYGATGPWANFPSQGTTLEATMGISAFTGYRGDVPWKVGQSYPDFLACWTGLAALMAALRHRRRTGEGQWIDLSMYQVGASLVPQALLQWQLDGTQPARIGNEHHQHVPSNAYPAAGDDRWVALTVETDAQWQALCGVMGRAELARDPRLATVAARQANRFECDRIVAVWMREQDPGSVWHRLQAAGVAAGPVLNNRDLFLDPQLRHRGYHERVQHPPPVGVRPLMGRGYRWQQRPLHARHRAPAYGEHNREVLARVCGYDAARIEELLASRVVCDTPAQELPLTPMGIPHLMKQRVVSEHDGDYRERLGIGG